MESKESILIIYELVPESTNIYLIPEEFVSSEDTLLLNASHGKFINSDQDTESLNKITEFLEDNGKWSKFLCKEIKDAPIVGANVKSIFFMGFIL